MHRVKLDSAPPSVKKFVRGLLLESDGVELELDGQVVCKVIGPHQLTEADREALLDKVTKQIRRAHQRNKDVPARVIEREVRDAVAQVRSLAER